MHAAALGGPATLENIRLLCKGHNALHAEQTYGRAHMAQFRRKQPRTGEVAYSGLSAGGSERLAQSGFLLEPTATP